MTPSQFGMNVATLHGNLDASAPITEIALPNGDSVRLETRLLLGDAAEATGSETTSTMGVANGREEVIPIIEEQLTVEKRTVETGRVRLVKTVSDYQEHLHEPLALRTFDVDRMVLNQPIEMLPAVRQEGATTIYPVVEEQLVLTKRLLLKEEIRVTMRDAERIDTQVVTLRREHLTVEREETPKNAAI